MKTIKTFTKQHPLLSYYALTFAISWGWILVFTGQGGFPVRADQFERLMVFVYPAMLVAPCLAAISLTGIIHGKAGFRDLGSQLIKWRVSVRWYVVAILTAPLIILGVLMVLSLISRKYLPLLYTSNDKAFLLWYPLAAGLATAIFEEVGWTGFATATMLRKGYSILRTGISVGFIFAAWNFLVVFWSGAGVGTLSPTIFLPIALFTWLPAFRVLIVWVYDRTGSLLMATLMSASLVTFWTSFTPQAALAGAPLALFYLVFTAATWVLIAILFRRQPSPRQRERFSWSESQSMKELRND
jgi:hypothetical protein